MSSQVMRHCHCHCHHHHHHHHNLDLLWGNIIGLCSQINLLIIVNAGYDEEDLEQSMLILLISILGVVLYCDADIDSSIV